jgi:hypothetical protein
MLVYIYTCEKTARVPVCYDMRGMLSARDTLLSTAKQLLQHGHLWTEGTTLLCM